MRSKFLTVAVAMVALAIPATAVAKPAGSGPGNSPNAKSCKEHWETLVREDGTGFANRGQCTRYAARGGTSYRPSEAPCLNGGYADYVTSTGQRFSDQDACVRYVRGGGQLQQPPGDEDEDVLVCVYGYAEHFVSPEDAASLVASGVAEYGSCPS